MPNEEFRLFLKRMGQSVVKGGKVAIAKQGNVVNIGKSIDHNIENTEKIREQAEAKTIVDEQVQEILLKAAVQCLDTKSVMIDAEENTPSLSLFPNRSSETVLVLDPIDGTLEYLNGSNKYNIVAGVIKKGKLVAGLIYFPVRDVLYFLDEDGKGKIAGDFSKKGFNGTKSLKPLPAKQKRIYVGYNISDELINKIKKEGYKVIKDTIDREFKWMDAFEGLLSGYFSATIFQTPQIRDVLLGVIVAANTGYVTDWNGNRLHFPATRRVPRVIIGTGKTLASLTKITKEA